MNMDRNQTGPPMFPIRWRGTDCELARRAGITAERECCDGCHSAAAIQGTPMPATLRYEELILPRVGVPARVQEYILHVCCAAGHGATCRGMSANEVDWYRDDKKIWRQLWG